MMEVGVGGTATADSLYECSRERKKGYSAGKGQEGRLLERRYKPGSQQSLNFSC